MRSIVKRIEKVWWDYTPKERHSAIIYILGIIFYKLGLEAYDYDAFVSDTAPKTFQRVGLMVGLNQAFQCVGSILVAPLVRRYPARWILMGAVLIFALFSAILLVMDACTGGSFAPAALHEHPQAEFRYYGRYSTDIMIPIYCLSGLGYGMVELVRRIIPRDIVGGNIKRLRRLDALVHIMYEVAGTAGAFCTALALIPRLGNNYAFIVTPICFTFAATAWFFLDDEMCRAEVAAESRNNRVSYFHAALSGFLLFFESIWVGARILFATRKFIWLLPGYSIALYAHRYLENAVAPAIARRYLGNAAWSQAMVGGSNLGELLGATFVVIFNNNVRTPIPWLRMDALMLLITWYLPFWHPQPRHLRDALFVAATFIPISFGWAAGDVSLAAYIQATLARMENTSRNVSPLSAVMAFLYSTYIVLYAVISPILGSYIDRVYIQTGGSTGGGDIHHAIRYVASVQFSIISLLVMVASFVPRGSLALNPWALEEEDLEEEDWGNLVIIKRKD
ncbi:hypothetical protein BO70DRAFT_367856 [Aspergillus heteromorphus CBS 117.55]|uniref:MFS general substrate transporter n=1 Tax=Aspergillus heteromorphus CBS 117.55 TaxID=1448321 RepID=A0A317X8I2_9EURO|nr:uncharacterized protein BO70DRAFT_367856 [Aspergillus heteromorphus CBS 117.55]PWY92870.1 hypothetical protein BO70DRAFT_367856 [Aspergillus heteromorphus CBS 117.55]